MRTHYLHAGPWVGALLCGALSCTAAWAQVAPQPSLSTAVGPVQIVSTKPLAAEEVAPLVALPGANKAQPTSISPDYKITPNDLLEVEVFGVSELKRTVRVNATGQISLPLIGMIQIAGLTPADAEALIALQYGSKYLQDPQVSIFIKEFTTQRITLDGALAKPGIYPLTGQITLLRALALAGGGAQLADMEQVMLFRLTPEGQSLVEKHDVNKIRKGEAPDPSLQADDVVVVNRDGARATLRDSLFRDILHAQPVFVHLPQCRGSLRPVAVEFY